MDLWNAAKVGDYWKLMAILDSGTDPNLTRWSGSTALHRAAGEGQSRCVALLLQRGANINSKAAWGWYTPLHLACKKGHEEICEMLIMKGANWKAKDKEGKTPMRWAIDGNNSSLGQKMESLDTKIQKEKFAKEQEAERQRNMKETDDKRRRQAERMAKMKAEQEALRQEQERAHQAATHSMRLCAFIALRAVAEIKVRSACCQLVDL